MKVCHVGYVPLPPQHPEYHKLNSSSWHQGRWVLNLALAQQEHSDIDPCVFVLVPGSKLVFPTKIETVDVCFVGGPKLARGKTGFFLDQRLLAREVMKLKPDIVHAHGTEEANALATLRCPVPRVLTIQGCFFIINRRIPARFFSRQWTVERLERRSIPKFAHVVTKSQYIRDEITAEFPSVTTHLIPNTYDPRLEKIPYDQPRDHAVAFVGSMDPRKGLDLIADAMEILRDSESRSQKSEVKSQTSDLRSPTSSPLPNLHIFGNRKGTASTFEKDVIGRLQAVLGDRLVLHGLVEQVEMAAIISRCAALVAPSREEMFGNQVIEALLVGTHAIVTDETAMAENVRRFGNGTIVPQEDPVALAEAISNALNPRPSALDISASARSAIISYMGPTAVAGHHQALYCKLIN
jgi:glycosyltransferase involved in cell wall biosynthesis